LIRKHKKEILFIILIFFGYFIHSYLIISISSFFLLYIIIFNIILKIKDDYLDYKVKITPEMIIEGENIKITYFFKFNYNFPPICEIIPDLPIYFIPIDKKNTVVEVKKDLNYEHSFILRTKKFGKYYIGNFKIKILDPLGLVQKEKYINLNIEVNVFPKIIRIEKSIIKLKEPSFGLKVKEKIFEDFTSIKGFSKYTGTEELKRIDWKISAHLGKLMIREYPSTAITSITMIVDAFASKNPRNQEIFIEHISTLVSSFSYYFELNRFNYGLWIIGKEKIKENNGKGHLLKILSEVTNINQEEEYDFNEYFQNNRKELKDLNNILLLKQTISIDELLNLIKIKSYNTNYTIFLLPDYGFLFPWEKPHPYILSETKEVENIRNIKDSLKKYGISIIILRGNESIKNFIFI